MSDKRLLEMAAKAADYFFQWNEKLDCLEVWNEGERTTRFWQPHRDDGDALRLAVRLKMKITVGNAIVMVEARGIPDVGEQFTDDPLAATRRAIVRAAAAIGEQMP